MRRGKKWHKKKQSEREESRQDVQKRGREEGERKECGDGMKGLPGPKQFNGPILAISSLKKDQILKNEKRPNKGQIFIKKC